MQRNGSAFMKPGKRALEENFVPILIKRKYRGNPEY